MFRSIWHRLTGRAGYSAASRESIADYHERPETEIRVVVQFDREASQTRDYCVAKNATHRAARPDPSLRKERLFRMTIKLDLYLSSREFGEPPGVPCVLRRLLSDRRGRVLRAFPRSPPRLPGA